MNSFQNICRKDRGNLHHAGEKVTEINAPGQDWFNYRLLWTLGASITMAVPYCLG